MYIIWFDYGCEGWQPQKAQDKKAILTAIKDSCQSNYIVTQEVEISLNLKIKDN